MVPELLEKYIWLINTFLRMGEKGLSLADLQDMWERRYGSAYPRSSFNHHRDAIAQIFGIEIECDRRTSRYFIRYGEDVKDSDAATSWLINTFTVNNLLSLGKERLSGRVSLEEIPSGHKYLTPVMEAMTDNLEIRISYRKYTGKDISSYTLRPYAVKESARRWYIAAYCIERDSMRVYGMDRIVSLEITGNHFTMPDGFDADTLFRNSFGVYLPDSRPEEIIFKASEKEARYLADLPLHHSQKIIAKDGNSVTFSIFVCPNESLVMELFRLGPRIEVLEPAHIRDGIAAMALETARLYDDSIVILNGRSETNGPHKNKDQSERQK